MESKNPIIWKAKKLLYNKLFLLSFLLLIALGLNSYVLSNKFYLPGKLSTQQTKLQTQQTNNSAVLGSGYYRYPQIYISSNQGGSSGGVISLASTDEPAVLIGGYGITAPMEVSVYQASEDNLLDYLTHDKDGKQIKKNPDISKLTFVTTVNNISSTSQGSKVTLPLKETGIWYLKVKTGTVETSAFVIRSNIGVLTEEGNNEFIFWGQNFKTKRSISDGTIKLLNLQDSRKELQTVSFNANGIAKANLNAEADIALVIQNNDRALVPINLKYLNYGYSYQQFQAKGKLIRYFIFTDRPFYKPGDTIDFKSVLRDDDDARYFIPSGEALVKIYNDSYYEGSNIKPIFEGNFPISSDGTISGQYQLPANAKTGYYTLAVSIPNQATGSNYSYGEWSSNTVSFNVEYFRKPESYIEVIVPTTIATAGDKTSFKISGQYFSGQPLLNQKVRYIVHSDDYYEYQYILDQQSLSQDLNDSYRYWYGYGEKEVMSGTAVLDKNGEAVIDLNTKTTFNEGKSQIFTIDATLDDGTQTPSFDRRNLIVYAGEYGIYRKDYSYGGAVNTQISMPISLVAYSNNTNVKNINLTAKIHRENWISYQEQGNKYLTYKKEEDDLPQLNVKTDNKGEAVFTFTPTKIGSYMVTIEGQDSRENLISKKFYTYISTEGQPYYTNYGNSDISIATDKLKYLPTDTVRFNIFSAIPDRDIFLTLERGRVDRFQIIHLNGKNGTVDVPLTNTDIPNIYAKVSSFSTYTLDSNQTNLSISPENQKLLVNITPNSKIYGPGETVTANISTTDVGGNPVSADVAIWAVDKAIFELSDNKLGDIFKTFWSERSDTTQEAHSLQGILVLQSERGGGCFAAGTKVLMSDGILKNIEQIKIGDYVMTRSEKDSKQVSAKVLKTYSAEENGYLILNGNLKLTADHILRVNDTWKEAGSIQAGDLLVDDQGKKVLVKSIEWQTGKFNVYNLEIEKYHTYFASGIWVHNDKGTQRETFKDTAYWNPSVHTDGLGRGQVSFKLPDNLTTWTLAAVGATSDTKVGQTTNEIVVTKDVIVRPILPNILRQGDEITLSAVVSNYTQQDEMFDIDLKFDSGEVESATRSAVIKSNKMQQFAWKVKPTKENDKSKLIFSAIAQNNKKLADVVTQEIPVRAFGFTEKKVETGDGSKTFSVKLAQDALKGKSEVTLSLASTIVGTLPTAMKYLINYPYGCVEQTTSRFVPTVIAKTNSVLFAEALKDKNIDDIIQKGLSRLMMLQLSEGGWGWWSSGKSDPFITAYVVEYILQARQAGIDVDSSLIANAQSYLANDQDNNRDSIVAKTYALTLLGVKDKVKKVTDFNNITPDILSLAVMANYLNGDKNSQTNGLNTLIAMAQPQGDAVFWQGGNKISFGSIDASTALAIRAILLAGGDRNLAVKGAKYLTQSRRTDYWSNTFATAQVVRALVDLSKTGNELTPNYTYSVTLDGKQIAQDIVTDSKQIINDITIPIASLKPDGSNVAINKSGDGQIYSTLITSEFHTDRNAKALNNGLSVTREYVHEKGEQYSLAVGDTVSVRISVGGLKAQENYGIISDELPSGLVPINPIFKNEQYGYDPNTYYSSFDVTDREVTENGMIMSLYQIAPLQRTYTYRARVVSEGTFIVPPATASLMYSPEVYGRSDVETLKVTKESEIIPGKEIQKAVQKFDQSKIRIIIIALIILLGGGFIFLKKRGVTFEQVLQKIKQIFKRDNSGPPITPPSSQPSV